MLLCRIRVIEEFPVRYYFAKYTSVMVEPSSAQSTPGGSQATPRGRRGRDDDPMGPDDLVTVANVHRVVSHEMLMEVFPERVMVGNNERLFRELARMSHIRIMTDCQSVPMMEAVAEGHPVYYRDDHARRGTPTVERRAGFEFTMAFAKLCYARGVLRREVDFSRQFDAGGVTPRRVRPRIMGGGGAADDGGGSGSGSQVAIVPSGEGPSSAPSPSTPSTPSPFWLPPADREAMVRWIESSPFVFVDRQHHKSARARLVEAEGAESSLRRQLAEARDAEKAAEEALQRATAVVGDLTSRASSAEARIEAVRRELQQRDLRIRELEAEVVQLTADLEVERVDRSELVDQLDYARQAAQGLLEELSQNVLEGPGDGGPPGDGPAVGDGPPPLTDPQRLAVAEAEVARLKTQLELTEEAVRVERLRNFADGSDRAAWDVERTTLQRDVDFAREVRDQVVRVYEELHTGLRQELAEAFGRTRAEKDPRRQWELLRQYDASVHSLAALRLSTHEVVTRKYCNRHYDPVLLEGIDLKMIVVQGNKAMWPPAAREVWNTANRDDDLEWIAIFFPGWAPLSPTDGGTIGLSPIWHRRDCGVCHNFFGPEGGYMPGSCSHPVHIACLLKLITTGTSCVVCRAPYHKRVWYPFAVEKHLPAAADLLHTRLSRYTAAHRGGQPMARRLEIIDRWEARADMDFADRHLVPDDRAHGYNVRERAIDLLHFYLCPARCRPGVAAEYLDELYEIVPSDWPVECHNFSRHFAPALSILHAGTANGQRPRRHGKAAQPRLVELSDDDDR
ncbi:hypothetical protein R1sor_007119 [Riccia sorocarpa]|uniref:RING-type domain-containing protein n=1 Tax=Riccia sorocarpa TaxID=122646 RepID=A0ABD3HPH7_9MARC